MLESLLWELKYGENRVLGCSKFKLYFNEYLP